MYSTFRTIKEAAMKIIIYLFLVFNLFATDGNDGGNGGSGSDVRLVIVENEVERISDEIFFFFEENQEPRMTFPEINITEFLEIKNQLTIEAAAETLIDKNGVRRTCLNFPTEIKIQCNLDFENLNDLPTAKYILVLHELLGLLGIEESNPNNPRLIQSYSISSRLNRYLSTVSTVKLGLNRSPCDLIEDFQDAEKCLEDYLRINNTNGSLIGHITWRNVRFERIKDDLSHYSPELEITESEFDYYGILKDIEEGGYTYIGINNGQNQRITNIATVSNALLHEMTEYSRGSHVEYIEAIGVYSLGLAEIMVYLLYDGL